MDLPLQAIQEGDFDDEPHYYDYGMTSKWGLLRFGMASARHPEPEEPQVYDNISVRLGDTATSRHRSGYLAEHRFDGLLMEA